MIDRTRCLRCGSVRRVRQALRVLLMIYGHLLLVRILIAGQPLLCLLLDADPRVGRFVQSVSLAGGAILD